MVCSPSDSSLRRDSQGDPIHRDCAVSFPKVREPRSRAKGGLGGQVGRSCSNAPPTGSTLRARPLSNPAEVSEIVRSSFRSSTTSSGVQFRNHFLRFRTLGFRTCRSLLGRQSGPRVRLTAGRRYPPSVHSPKVRLGMPRDGSFRPDRGPDRPHGRDSGCQDARATTNLGRFELSWWLTPGSVRQQPLLMRSPLLGWTRQKLNPGTDNQRQRQGPGQPAPAVRNSLGISPGLLATQSASAASRLMS